MAKFKITWEERYSIIIEAKNKEEARDKWEGLSREEMDNAYQETTHFEAEKEEE